MTEAISSRMKRVIAYMIDKLNETSTWRGIALVLSAAGGALNPAHVDLFILGGMTVAGLIAVAFPDYKGSIEARKHDANPKP